MVKDGAEVQGIPSLKGYQNRIIGSKVTAILLQGGFCLLVELHRGGSAPAACAAGLFITIPRLESFYHAMYY